MKRLILLILVLVALTLPALAQVRLGLSSNVKNGGFEIDTDANGQPDSWGQVRIQAGIDGLVCDQSAYAGCAYRFSVSSGTKWLVQGVKQYAPVHATITVSAWVQSTSPYARFAAVFYSNGSVVEAPVISITPSSKWQQVTISRQYPTFVDRVVIHLGQVGAGVATFDDVRLSVGR